MYPSKTLANIQLTNNNSGNTAVGYLAARQLIGQYSVVIGTKAADDLTTGNNTVAIGYRAGGDADVDLEGSNNTSVGYSAGINFQGACTNNTCIGEAAGGSITTGDNNLVLGHDAGKSGSPVTITTGDNTICLGNNSIAAFYCADDSISTSDGRDKTDVETFTHGLDFVNQMRPVTYRWDKRSWYAGDDATDEEVNSATPDGSKKRQSIKIGFIGQEVQAIERQYGYSEVKEDGSVDTDTELVVDTTTTQVGLQYSRVVPILVKAVQELSIKVEEQAKRIEELKK